MSEHLNKRVWGGVLFLVICMVIWFAPLGALRNVAYGDDVQLKEIESLGSRLRERIVSFRLDRGRGGVEYNIAIVNLGRDPIYPPLRVALNSVSVGDVTLDSPDGQIDGKDYIELDETHLPGGVLDPGEQISDLLIFFNNPSRQKFTFDLSFYGRMEMKEMTFASVGVNPRAELSEITLKNVSMRLDRVRGGVEYQVRVQNNGTNVYYGPMRVIVDSIDGTGVEFDDLYGYTEDGKPYIVVEDEIADGILEPGEESNGFWMFFSNPSNVRFRFQSKTAGYSGYYYDISDSVIVTFEETLRELGISKFNLSLKNNSKTPLTGPVRVKINSITVNGTQYTQNLDTMIQSEDGMVGNVPFMTALSSGVVLNQEQLSTVELVCSNQSENDMTFSVSVEALYQGLPVMSDLSVVTDSIVPDAANGETSHLVTVTNNGTNSVLDPVILVIDNISTAGITVKNPSGYLLGKPFIKIDLAEPTLDEAESTPQAEIVFDNPQQAAFTVSYSVQAALALSAVIIDTTPPVTLHDYASPNIWTKNDAAITLTATDDITGVKETRYSINNGADQIGNQIQVISEGQTFIDFWSIDNADNVEAEQLLIVKIDKSVPITTNNYPASGQWRNQPANITLSATDVYSQVKNTYFTIDGGAQQTGTAVSVSAEGEHVVQYYSEDYVGNVETANSIIVKIDTTAPVSSDNFNGELAIGSLSITITATDNLSGVQTTYFKINDNAVQTGNSIFIATPGNYNILYWSVDKAGNVEQQHLIQATVSTPPSFNVTFPQNGYRTAAGTVTVTGTISDSSASISIGNVVGTVANGQFEIPNLPLQEGDQYYTVEAVNTAGLKTSLFLRVIKDSTPPQIQITSPANNYVTALTSIVVTGQVMETGASLYIQGATSDTKVTLATDGTFSISPFTLANEGANVLTLYAVDDLGNSHKVLGTQKQLTVYRDTTAPTFSVQVALYNADGSKKPLQSLTGSAVTLYNQVAKMDIYGQVTDPTNTVKIQGSDVTVAGDGSFQKLGVTLSLAEGQSGTVTVAVSDAVLNLAKIDITLIKDTTGPEIFVTSPQTGQLTNDPSARTISGVARGTSSVTANGSTFPVVNERFEVTGWALAQQGVNSLSIMGYDSIGNPTTVIFTMLLDSTAPTSAVVTSPAVLPLYTNKDRVTITGTGEPSAKVLITGGALDVEANVSGAGQFTQDVFLKTNTTNNIRLVQKDTAGNTSPEVVLTVIQDMVKPTVAIVAPAINQLESNSVIVSGTASDNKLLKNTVVLKLLKASDSSEVSSANIAVTNGQFNSILTLPQEGDFIIRVTAEDQAGNTQTANKNINYTIVSDDTEGPTILITTPQSNSYINNAALTVTGTCLDRSSVTSLQISLNSGTFTDITTFDNGGTGTFSHLLNLSGDGAYTITIKAVDGSPIPTESQKSVSFTLDTVPPMTAPTVSGVTPAVEVDNDSYMTSVDFIKIIGAYEPGYTVRATSSLETKEAVANASGVYSIDIHIAKSATQNVDNVINLVGVDKAGNLSTATDSNLKAVITVTYDVIKPQVTAVNPANNTPNVALNAEVTVYFSESVAQNSLSDSQGNRMYVQDSQGNIISGTLSAVQGSNNREFVIGLANGGYPDGEEMTVVVSQKIHDLAGNTLATTFQSKFTTVDVTAPTIPVITNVSPAYLTNAASVNITGTAEKNASVLVYRDNEAVAVTTVNGTGSFAVAVSLLANQQNKFTLTARDASMNESNKTAVITVTHDNILPVFESITPAEGSVNILKNTVFEIRFNEVINQSTVTNGFTIKGKNNRTVAGTLTPITNAAGNLNAGFRFTPTSLLLDGETVTITLTNALKDSAGNSLDLSAEVGGVKTFVFPVEDLLAPTVPVIATVSEESPTNASTVDVTGTAEPGATVKINGGGLTSSGMQVTADPSTGAFSATIPLKADNSNSIAFKAVDAANNSSESTSIQLFCDKKAPMANNVIPKDGEQIPDSRLFTIVFNEAIDQTTIPDGIILKKGDTAVAVNRNINENGSIVTLKAVDAFDINFIYTLEINTQIKDLAGNAFANTRVYTYLSDDKIFPEAPVLYTISENSPTNATQVTITGIGASDGVSKVYALDKNDTILAQSDLDEYYVFTLNVPLQVDKLNQIRVVSRRPSGNQSSAKVVNIYQDSTAPVVNILAPQSDVTLPSDTVTLVAEIQDASSISSCKVIGQEKVTNIDLNGYLTTVLTGITNGQTVEVVVVDAVGLTTTDTVTLTVDVEDPETDTSAPIITFVYPPDGMNYDGKVIDVTGTVEDANEISIITVNDVIVTTPDAFPTPASFLRGKIELVDGPNVITISATDVKNNVGEESITIYVDVAPPSISISSPANEAIFLDSDVTISGVVTDSNGIAGFTVNDIEVSFNGNGSFEYPMTLDEGENLIVFKATDIADNVTVKELTLYYDVEGPEIVAMFPKDGATYVPANTSIYATFTERVDPETVSFNTVKLIYIDEAGDEAYEVTGNVTVDNKTVFFHPNLLLKPAMRYKFKIREGIKDLVGFDLQAPQEANFTIDQQITMVTGSVSDTVTCQGIPNVTVRILGTDISAKTDPQGNFYLQKDNIPGGNQVLYVDGTTADEIEPGVGYFSSFRKHYIEVSQINEISGSFFLPRVKANSVEYVTGNEEQILDFNGTITGIIDDQNIEFGYFQMTVPAGALEFPNGSTSGSLSARLIHETWLPTPKVESTGSELSVMSAVWFDPFVKCNEPVHIELPIPRDIEGFAASPGDRLFILSYDSETGEWVDAGTGRVNDEGTRLIMDDDTNTLKELTIVAFFPYSIPEETEAELRSMYKVGYGGGDENFWMLIELMVAISIMAMMSPISLLVWKVGYPTGMGGAPFVPLPLTRVWILGKTNWANGLGNVLDMWYFPLFPNLAWLMMLLSIWIDVTPWADVSFTAFGPLGSRSPRRFPVPGITQTHSVMNHYFLRNIRIYVDFWYISGNVRVVGDNGQAITPSGTGNIGIYVYSESPWATGYHGGSGFSLNGIDGLPVLSTQAANQPYEVDPAMKWYKSYGRHIYMAWIGVSGLSRRGHEVTPPDGSSYTVYRSYIYAGSKVRIVGKMDDGTGVYTGEVYVTAPTPVADPGSGDIHNVNIFANLSIGRLNIDTYVVRTYTRNNQIVAMTLPFKGLASANDVALNLHTGTAMYNGDKTPIQSGVVFGQVGGAAGGSFSIDANSDSPWMVQNPGAGAYKVEISPYASDFAAKSLLYINIKTNQSTSSTSGTGSGGSSSDSAPVTRPQSGRGTGSTANYVTPRTDTRSAQRVTPAPAAGTLRKGYVWFVVPTLMFNDNNFNDHCSGTIKYMNWTAWYDTWDPSSLPPEQQKSLFPSPMSNPEDIKIKFNTQNEVALSMTLTFNSPGSGSVSIPEGPDGGTAKSYSLGTDGAVVLKITQIGQPYVLGLKFKDDFATLLTDDNQANDNQIMIPGDFNVDGGTSVFDANAIRGTTSTISEFFMVNIGSLSSLGNLTFEFIPQPQSGYGVPEIVKYLDAIEGKLMQSFTTRKIVIEIIDKQTLRPDEGYSHSVTTTTGTVSIDFDPTDNIYNQLERLTIYLE